MTSLGEGAASHRINQDPPETPSKDIKAIKIRLAFFFDGTLNNRTNIAEREKYDRLQKDLDEKYPLINNRSHRRKYGRERSRKLSDNAYANKNVYQKNFVVSYNNDYSNIVYLDEILDTDHKGDYDIFEKIYIEGVGTENLSHDKMIKGGALGKGKTGIRAKVNRAVSILKQQLLIIAKDKYKVSELSLDFFGFSRGAATARFAITQLLDGATYPLDQALEDLGFVLQLPNGPKINFVGIYDTVPAHGLDHTDDVAELKQRNIAEAQRVLHLCAADEHRKNFSLVTASSAKGKGREIYLPGVHSDVGGGYRDELAEAEQQKHQAYAKLRRGEMTETKYHETLQTKDILLRRSSNRSTIEADKEYFIQLGYYQDNELYIKGGHGRSRSYSLMAKARSVPNDYYRIGLHIMADEYKDHGNVGYKQKIFDGYNIPEDLQQEYQAITAYVNRIQDIGFSHENDWLLCQEPWLKDLRRRYLHISAKPDTIGMGPRFEPEASEFQSGRKRCLFEG